MHQSNSLPALNIVGLPEASVRESKDRVRGALPATLAARKAGWALLLLLENPDEVVLSPHVAECHRMLDRHSGSV